MRVLNGSLSIVLLLSLDAGPTAFAEAPAVATSRATGAADAAARTPQSYEFTEVHMGLPVRIHLYAADERAARQAAQSAFTRIATLDLMMSDYRADSELRRLEPRAGEWVPVSPELFIVLERAVEIARATDGAFEPTIAPLVALWRDARKSGRLPERQTIEAARARVGWRQVDLDTKRRAIRLAKPGIRLDLGGIAKGYILQEALRTICAHGVTRTLVEAGGDIVVGDAPPGRPGWRIDTSAGDPAFRERAARLTNAALATSGATAQFVEIDGVRYSHVIDPRTGLGVTNHYVAHVLAEDAGTADALATALTVLGPDFVRALSKRYPDTFVSIEQATDGPPQEPAARAKDAYARAVELESQGNLSGALSLLWEPDGAARTAR